MHAMILKRKFILIRCYHIFYVMISSWVESVWSRSLNRSPCVTSSPSFHPVRAPFYRDRVRPGCWSSDESSANHWLYGLIRGLRPDARVPALHHDSLGACFSWSESTVTWCSWRPRCCLNEARDCSKLSARHNQRPLPSDHELASPCHDHPW